MHRTASPVKQLEWQGHAATTKEQENKEERVGNKQAKRDKEIPQGDDKKRWPGHGLKAESSVHESL